MSTERPQLKIVGDKPAYDEELRTWLAKHIADNAHLNPVVLARADHIGYSRTAISDYLEGTYFLSKEQGGKGVEKSRLENLIRAYREKVEGTVRHGYANTFVDTRSWQQFQHACHTAITESVIVVVYAKPGVGKSRCLQEYSIRKTTTMPIQLLCSTNVTTRYFIQKVARELGIDDKPVTAKLEDLVAEKLKRNPRPIFVDQANYLNEKSLGSICYIWEVARVPFVLIGTKDLYDLFTTTRLTEDVRAQLSSRVAMHYPLMELAQAEVKAIVKRALGSYASDEVIAKIYTVTGGIHRHVDMIIPRINELTQRNQGKLENSEITMSDIVDTAGRRLMVG